MRAAIRPSATPTRIDRGARTSSAPPRSAPTGCRASDSPSATADLLATLRSASPSDGAEKVVELLNKGIDPASVWDGLFLRPANC